MFCKMLKYKAENEGKTYIEVDRFFPSSKTCNVCLNQVGSLPLDIRTWTCEHCQTTHDRDINASINIKNEALRILSLGTSDTANRPLQKINYGSLFGAGRSIWDIQISNFSVKLSPKCFAPTKYYKLIQCFLEKSI